jgi:hypothetical protein
VVEGEGEWGLPGVRVKAQAEGAGGEVSGVSGDGGRFVLDDAADGVYSVTIEKDGFNPVQYRVRVLRRCRNELVLRMRATGT